MQAPRIQTRHSFCGASAKILWEDFNNKQKKPPAQIRAEGFAYLMHFASLIKVSCDMGESLRNRSISFASLKVIDVAYSLPLKKSDREMLSALQMEWSVQIVGLELPWVIWYSEESEIPAFVANSLAE